LDDLFTIVIISPRRGHNPHYRFIISYTLQVAGRPGSEAITVLRSLA